MKKIGNIHAFKYGVDENPYLSIFLKTPFYLVPLFKNPSNLLTLSVLNIDSKNKTEFYDIVDYLNSNEINAVAINARNISDFDDDQLINCYSDLVVRSISRSANYDKSALLIYHNDKSAFRYMFKANELVKVLLNYAIDGYNLLEESSKSY